jgi:muconolactone D-isomerase
VSTEARPDGGVDSASDGAGRIEFHVEIVVRLPAEWTGERRDATLSAERARAQELIRAGTIQRIWRIPGGLHNVGIWCADSAGDLHDAIASLPCFPWLTANVRAIAPHPAEVASRTHA